MRHVLVLISCLGPPLSGAVLADPPGPRATPARRLPGRYLGFEPTVATSADGRVLVAAIDVRRPAGSPDESRILGWRSADGGRTWSEPDELRPRPRGGAAQGDPYLASDATGRFYLAFQEDLGPRHADGRRALFQHSDDGGATWTDARPFDGRMDKIVLAAESGGRSLVLAFTALGDRSGLRVFRSADRGTSWDELPDAGGASFRLRQPFGIATRPNGAIAVACEAQGSGTTVRLLVSGTRDGKAWSETELGHFRLRERRLDGQIPALAAWGPGVAHAVYALPDDAELTRSSLWHRTSADLATWSEPVRLSGGEGEWAGFPDAGVGASGRVHVAWMERRAGRWRVLYRGSADGGRTWTDPLPVSRPEAPTEFLTEDGFAEPGGHYMGLAEGARGTVHLAWGAGAGPAGHGEIWYATVDWPSTDP